MGFESRTNKAVPVAGIVELLRILQEDIADTIEVKADQLTKIGCYITLITCALLRGYERFFAELMGTIHHIEGQGRSHTSGPHEEALDRDRGHHTNTCHYMPPRRFQWRIWNNSSCDSIGLRNHFWCYDEKVDQSSAWCLQKRKENHGSKIYFTK